MGARVPEGRPWSLDVPSSWDWEDGSPAMAFARRDGLGVLQISAHTKHDGDVTFFDVMSTASERCDESVPLDACDVGDFRGLVATVARPEGHFREWWLSAGPTFVYVTYNCSLEHAGAEDEEVDAVLATLRDELRNPTPPSWGDGDGPLEPWQMP